MVVEDMIKIFHRRALKQVEEAYIVREVFLEQIELLYDGYFKRCKSSKSGFWRNKESNRVR